MHAKLKYWGIGKASRPLAILLGLVRLAPEHLLSPALNRSHWMKFLWSVLKRRRSYDGAFAQTLAEFSG